MAINKKGVGGTKISTTVALTTLVTPIHKASTKAFISWAKSSNIELVVPPVKPFDLCFSSKNIGSTRVGPAVPTIDLVLPGENVSWKIFGANSMVPVSEGVLCLGFLDGGSMKATTPLTITPTASIVIGGISWRIIFWSLIWMLQGQGSALPFSLGRPHVPTSTSHPMPRDSPLNLLQLFISFCVHFVFFFFL